MKGDQFMETRPGSLAERRHFRFHEPHVHLASVFGDTWFGEKAEAFARFFGTPTFLVGQTLVVAIWIAVNVIGWTRFDVYPFILLNLAFSLQAAYAAPLILLAQTRQADRDVAHAIADAEHREALHSTVKLTESGWPSLSRFAEREATDWAGFEQTCPRRGTLTLQPSTAA